MSGLQIRGLTKSFGGTRVLNGVDLTVPSGAMAAVLGPSGCGKTTLLRIVAGFEEAEDGVVYVGGRRVVSGRGGLLPEHRRIGVVPQEGALFPHLSVAENVAFGLSRRGGGRRRRDRVRDLLALVGLADLGDRMPSQLSGGQQQRVALARALAPEPDVVLLDEPFSALDAGLRAALREDVRSVLRAAATTAVLVTHDQEEALSTADVVAVMRAGVVVQAAAPADLYQHPTDLETATFVGEAVVLPARVDSGGAETALGRLPLLRGDAVSAGAGVVVIRPEQVHIVAPHRGTRATVAGVTFYGHDASVRLLLPGGEEVLCRTQDRLPDPGTEVGLIVAGPVSIFSEDARLPARTGAPRADAAPRAARLTT